MKDAEIQSWLKKVDPVKLGIGLLHAGDDIKNCVIRNMSERAAAILINDMKRYNAMDAKELIILMNLNDIESLI